jgi:cytochrome c oxidase subunit 3
VLFFGGLILAYTVYRSAYPDGFAEAARHTRIVIGTINTVILLTSSFFVAWAVAIVPRCEARAGALLLGAAALLGCVFLALKGVEYRLEYDEGLVPGRYFAFTGQDPHAASLFFAFYFVATGLHAVHVAIGIVVLVVIALRTRARAYSERYYAPVTVAGLYWHFVDLVWVVLFALIYLPGRST